MVNSGDILQQRYRVIAQLGQGGMGAVYKAWDARLNVPVALKEMTAQASDQSGQQADLLQELRSQFQQEAVVLARLSHPNLVPVSDYFQEGENVYLVMRFVEGESLAGLIERYGPVPEPQVVTWTLQLLNALAYCHSEGVIHRDIKPQNIIIRPDGNAILVDFGLVKLWNPNDPRTRTAVRGIGTPQYAPPEQYETAAGHTEPRSDLYSLGATMYHALTGQAPPSATLRISAPEEFRPVRSINASISPRTAAVIERAMQLPRSQRWLTASEMALAIDPAVSEPGAAYVQVEAPAQAARGSGRRATGAPAVAVVGGRAHTSAMPGVTGSAAPARRISVPLLLLGVVGLLVLVAGAAAALHFTGVIDFDALLGRPAPTQMAPLVSTATRVALTRTRRPTRTPTLTPTRAASPTATPTPTLTPRPSSTLEGIALESLTPTPTSTSTLPPTLTPDNKPTVTTAPAQSTGALIDFEQWGTWRRGDQPYGELNQTTEQAKGGTRAAKLTYDFPAGEVEQDFVVFLQSRSIGGRPDTFGAWVYGDGSGHYVNLWIKDAQGQVWSVHLGTVGSGGWQQLSGKLAPNLPWPSGTISGPDNGAIDYPVQFYALVLDRPGKGPQKGTVYIDEIQAWASGAAAPTVAPAAASSTQQPTAAPTAAASSGAIGQIVFTVETGEGMYLYSTDPGWSQMVEIGKTDSGHSTCAGGGTASTLTGTSVNLYGSSSCAVTERTDACTSPDRQYQLITSFQPGWTYAVLLKNVATGTEEFIYQGVLNGKVGIRWAPNSQMVYFGVDRGINIVRVGGAGYQQVIGFYDDSWAPQFSPDGTRLFYLKPSGAEGNSDVFIVNSDGTGERNLTNAPVARKTCPRWRY